MDNPASLAIRLLPVVNFALHQNSASFLHEVTITNHTDAPIEDARLHITFDPAFADPIELPIEQIPAGREFSTGELSPALSTELLLGLTERLTGHITFTLTAADQELAREVREISLLAYDEWHGSSCLPDLICAFVTPNHPQISAVLVRAADLLGEWTGDPAFDAYQSGDANRILKQAAAIYGALQELNIVYAVSPAHFGSVGQRVRLCDTIVSGKLANCLDMTLFYCSCLEAAGLHPIILLTENHAFAGLWLEDHTFPESVVYDKSLVVKRLADGVTEMAVVECTLPLAGHNAGFDDAMRSAAEKLSGEIEMIIDVRRARLSGIYPIPQRIQTETGWTIQRPKRDGEQLTDAPAALGENVVVNEVESLPLGKVALWERKLLDLGLRNALINLRPTKGLIPLLTASLSGLEDGLADGVEYGISPCPQEMKLPEDEPVFEVCGKLGDSSPLIASEMSNRRLRAALSEGELARSVKELYRSAKSSIEENGANTLFLALGLLRWYETKSSKKPRYAPLILLPVDIVRKSALKGYVIRLRDEEPQMNITLLEMLRQDFGITIGGLDTLTRDEHGIAVREILAVIRRAVMDQPRWDVLESAHLGIFSFSQFVMWNDLHDRLDDIRKNKIVSSLIDGKLAWNAEPMEVGERVPEDGVLLPMSADASQLYAIEAAAGGKSFVLHGPPGTGKSQTITVLIANALAQGKTILFVAEKLAALQVVEKRLNSLGIGAFCLELHSNKSRKRDVLEQLKAASEAAAGTSDGAFARRAETAAARRAELDAYAAALHTPRRSGRTLYQLISLYEGCNPSVPVVSLGRGFAAGCGERLLEDIPALVGSLIAAGREIGHPQKHPLTPVRVSGYSQELREQAPAAVEAYRAALDEYAEAAADFIAAEGWRTPAAFDEYNTLYETAKLLGFWQEVPAAWAKSDDLPALTARIRDLCAHASEAGRLAGELTAAFRESVFTLDAASLQAQWNEASAQWLLPRAMGQGKVKKALSAHASGKLDTDKIPAILTSLIRYQNESNTTKSQLDRLVDSLGALYSDRSTNWAKVSALADAADQNNAALDVLGTDELRRNGVNGALMAKISRFIAAHERLLPCRQRLHDLLAIEDSPAADWLAGERSLCDAIASNMSRLKAWCGWNAARAAMLDAGFAKLVEAYEGGIAHEQVEAVCEKSVWAALVNYTIDTDAVLSAFSGAQFNDKIARFRELDEELTALAKEEIYCRISANVPNMAREASQSSEVGILQRAIRSGGRGVSLRRLFEQIPNLLPRLCPCMLMSPISAAQYLDPKRKPFDLVVFDEASQLPTCKAVGAIARAENAVIVGDPKQMPPTAFFTGTTTDEDAPETDDLESILDDCLALNLPQTHLTWHYRSRHESLIAFSNHRFYENRLYTFPSVNDRTAKVTLVKVNGSFDRGKSRTNRAEAEAIIAELKRRAHDPSAKKLSVGVVTFNISQQALIEDLLEEACAADTQLEAWAYGGEEPVFVKNLENVQGDERDVILFSVAFAPDTDGSFYMNFGPLNRDGGWRRLNVAVTRSKHEMMVFSSINPEQIDLSRTSSEGVAALRAFLEYASGRELAENAATVRTGKRAHGTADAICAALAEKGWEARQSIGHSAYKIDIGILDPDDEGRYLLGIMLDGETYAEAKTTRDRELAQISVLRGLGWSIHRVWSPDWWENPERELERILAAIRDAIDAAKAAREAASAQVVEEESVPEAEPLREAAAPVKEKESPVTPYRAAKLSAPTLTSEQFSMAENGGLLTSLMREIIAVEAPICQSLATKRLLQACGISRAGSRMQAQLDALYQSLNLQTTTQNDERVFWADRQSPEEYTLIRSSGEGDCRRDADQVPQREIVNAALLILREQIGLPKDELVRESAKLLGYTRLGSVVLPAMEAGIGAADGRIAVDEHGYCTLG